MLARGNKPWIAVVHPRRANGGISLAVVAELEQRGRPARILGDGDATILDAEAVLLMGSLGSLRRTARILKHSNRKRPFVVAWVSEPLPPPGMPSWALDAAQAVSPVRAGTVWARPLLHFVTHPLHLLNHRFGLPSELRREISARALRFTHDNLAFLRLGLKGGWIDALTVSTEQKRLYLAEKGIESTFMPVGQQTAFGRLLNIERDIDVLFIGNIKSEQRRRNLKFILRELRKRGLTTSFPRGGIYGEERTRLVNRARVVLHLHNFSWDTPWVRWMLAIANGAVIASEPLSVPQPLRPNIDFLSAPLEELPDEIEALIGDEERRRSILESCRATVEREMSLKVSVERLCAILQAQQLKERTR